MVVPFPSIKVSKHVELTGDANGDGLFNAGDTVTYTIRVNNQSPRDIATGAFTIFDPVLNQMEYIQGSTRYSCSSGSSLLTIADSSSGSRFPLDEGLASRCVLGSKGGEHAISFRARILDNAVNELTNAGTLKSTITSDIPFEVTVPLVIPPKCTTYFPATGLTRQCFDAKAGQHIYAGRVCVELVDGRTSEVKITYDTNGSFACLKEVQAYIGDNIPTGSTGNPMIGNFPLKATISATCLKTYTFTTTLPLTCTNGQTFKDRVLKLAAHSSVQFTDGNGGQTAWSIGNDITSGGSWASYSDVRLTCSCGEDIPIVVTKAPTKASK